VFARLGGPYVRVRTAGPLTSPLLLAVNLVVHLKSHPLPVSYPHFVLLLKAGLKLPHGDFCVEPQANKRSDSNEFRRTEGELALRKWDHFLYLAVQPQSKQIHTRQ